MENIIDIANRIIDLDPYGVRDAEETPESTTDGEKADETQTSPETGKNSTIKEATPGSLQELKTGDFSGIYSSIDGKPLYYTGAIDSMKYNGVPCVFLASDINNRLTFARWTQQDLNKRGYFIGGYKPAADHPGADSEKATTTGGADPETFYTVENDRGELITAGAAEDRPTASRQAADAARDYTRDTGRPARYTVGGSKTPTADAAREYIAKQTAAQAADGVQAETATTDGGKAPTDTPKKAETAPQEPHPYRLPPATATARNAPKIDHIRPARSYPQFTHAGAPTFSGKSMRPGTDGG